MTEAEVKTAAPAEGGKKGGKRGGGKGGKGEKGGKKGAKGGDKGGKGGDKGGKRSYDGPRRPRRFNEDADLEKEERTVEQLREERDRVAALVDTKKADLKKLKEVKEDADPAEQKARTEELNAQIEEKKTAKAGVNEALTAQNAVVNALHTQRTKLRDQKKEILGEMSAKKKEAGISYTESDVTEAIRQVELKHESTGMLSKNAERNFMRQLKELENVRTSLRGLSKYNVAADAKEKEVQAVQEKLNVENKARDVVKDQVRELADGIRKLEDQIGGKKDGNKEEIKQAESELDKLNGQVKGVERRLNYKEAKQRSVEDWVCFEKEEKEYKENEVKRRAEEEERRMQTDVDYRERKERQARIEKEKEVQRAEMEEIRAKDPWKNERELCDTLISYLEKATGSKSSAAAGKPAQLSDKEKMEEAMKKMHERTGHAANVKKEGEGFMKLKIAKEEPKKKPALAAVPVKAKEEEKKDDRRVHEKALNHTLDKFEAFDKLKVDTPLTHAEVPAVLVALKKRREWVETADKDAKMEELRTTPPKKEAERAERAEKPRGDKREKKGSKGEKGSKGGKGSKAGNKSRNTQ